MQVRLPARVSLPSGLHVWVAAGPAPAVAPRSLREAAEAMDGRVILLRDAAGAPLPLVDMRLDDFHVLRALAVAAGRLLEPPITVACDNCDEPLSLRPSLEIEFGPYLHGELGDPELDAPFPFGQPVAIAPLSLGRAEARDARFSPVTVAAAAPLFRALEAPALRVTSAVVRGLGLASLGEERHHGRIARALQNASDEAFSSVLDRFNEAFYPERLVARVRCPACGARTPVEAPALREFGAGPSARDALLEDFPSVDAFTARVEALAEPLLARLGASYVAVFVVDDIPACDDGGSPLLGSYDPPDPLAAPPTPPTPPEIRLYYRSFRALARDEGIGRLEPELAETLEHELDHHLAFLRGHDPLDEAERAAIESEASRLVGPTEARRRASRALRSSLHDFAYRTWPLWLIALLAAIITYLTDR